MSMDLAKKTFSTQPDYLIAGTAEIVTATKEVGSAALKRGAPVVLGEDGKLAAVKVSGSGTYTVDTTGLYGILAEDADTGEEGIVYLSGEDLYSGMTPAQRAAQKLMEEYATLNDATTRREEWMAVQAIMTGSIPVVGEGVNEVIDFGFTNKVTLSGDNKWGGSKADIQGNLGDWVDKVLHGGFANVDMAILGKTAKKHLFNDATIQKMLDNRRMNMGELAPRDLPNGVRYLGRLTDPSLELYSYGEVYYDDWTDPEEPATKPLVPDNQVVLISSRPNYMLAYGLCTYIDDASQMWVTAQTSRLLRSYVEHHPDRRMVELQTHPLPIPDKVDSWMVATVC